MLVCAELGFVDNSYNNTFTNMGLANRVGAVIIFFCLSANPFASVNRPYIDSFTIIALAVIISIDIDTVVELRDETTPEHGHGLHAHLLTTVAHEVGSILNYLTIFIGHSHAVYIDVGLTSNRNIFCKITILSIKNGGIRNRRTPIREHGLLTILLDELLVLQLGVVGGRHNGCAGSGEADYLVVNSLALPQLTLEYLGVLLTELIVSIEATLIVLQDYAASAGYITPIIDGLTLSTKKPIKKSSLVALQYRQVAGSLRSAVHLQSDFDFITRLERTEVVCQLLGICVLCKERSSRNLLLASSVTLGHGTTASVGTRNILAANLMSIDESVDYITYMKPSASIAQIKAIVKARDRKEQAVRLLTTKTNCGYVTLVGVHVASAVIAGVVLLAEEVILLCELHRQLTVGRKIYTDFAFCMVGGYTDSIAKHISKKQTVSIRVLAYIGQYGYISFIHIYYLLF
jgi:hypothetical protein